MPIVPLVETAIAFAAAMLAASLLVSAGVQIAINVGQYQTRTVRQLLQAVIHGFRFFNNDPAVIRDASPGAAAPAPSVPSLADVQKSEQLFVKDVMTDPSLHNHGTSAEGADDPISVAKKLDYIGGADLILLVYNHATYEHRNTVAPAPNSTDPTLSLPATWFEGKPPPYATTGNFEAYVKRWFGTLDATASQRYKAQTRQLTLLISVIAVVLLNLDSVSLVRSLYQNSSMRAAENQHVPALEKLADPQVSPDDKAPPGGQSNAAAAAQMRQALVALDEPGLGLGWQDSWIVRRFCGYRGTCGSDVPPVDGVRLALDVFEWIFGLLASCLLLSFGAPFWYGALKDLLNLKNEVSQATGSASPADWQKPAPPAEAKN